MSKTLSIEDYELDLEKCIWKSDYGELYLTSKKGDSNKYVTMKLERKKLDGTDKKKYLANEIMFLNTLDHPNILKFKDLKKDKLNYFVVKEYCNGGKLLKSFEKYKEKYGKPFSEEIIQHLMKQIINAFKYLHGKKILHKTLTMDNILLNYETELDEENFNLMKAQVKLSDFSTVFKKDDKPIVFSAHYRPSDSEIECNKITKAANIWLIGTMCYEMLIGKQAFNIEEIDEPNKKVIEDNVPNKLSYEIVSFLNGMLLNDSSKRLTAEQLSRHVFLNKNIKDFKFIDLQKASKKVDGNELNINDNINNSIWSIFNPDSDKLLTDIPGEQLIEN